MVHQSEARLRFRSSIGRDVILYLLCLHRCTCLSVACVHTTAYLMARIDMPLAKKDLEGSKLQVYCVLYSELMEQCRAL